jgi:uncharacterized protein
MYVRPAEERGEGEEASGPAGGDSLRMVAIVAAGLALAYLVLLALARLFGERMIFFPHVPGRLSGDWHPPGLPVEDVEFRAGDGVRLHAWWLPVAGAEATFLAFHGNAGNIAMRAEVYRHLSGLPANVLAVEYRGYGRSDGAPSEAGFYRDAEAAYRYLVCDRGLASGEIILYGASLGSAVAAHLAAEVPAGAVVLEAPFPSARAVARRVYWMVPYVGWALRSKFDTAASLRQTRAPLLIVHATGDRTIPLSLGQEVYRQAREPKDFLVVEGPGHEGVLVEAAGFGLRLRSLLGRAAEAR